jgi:putative flippase GtrA
MINETVIQAVKYGIVGIFNTLLTAITIWVMMQWIFDPKRCQIALPIAITVSNIVGYTVGLINSFVCNRSWTFKSRKTWKMDFLKFMGVFLICYIPQLLLVILLNKFINILTIHFNVFNYEYILTSAYLCQLIGIVFYTILNFLCNKYYTFK